MCEMQTEGRVLVHHDCEPRRAGRCGLNDHGARLRREEIMLRASISIPGGREDAPATDAYPR
jgi:hypothetical protein